jgi:hypothetical protein
MQAKGKLLDVQNDIDDVLPNALERGELVDDTVDLNGGDGRPLEGGQKDPAKAVTEGNAKTPLEGFGHQTRLASGVGAKLDGRLFRAGEFVPVSFNHV